MSKGIIDESQYLRVSESIKKEIEKYIDEFLSIENPTRELIIDLVEKIYVYQDKSIAIIFTFNNY